MITGLDHIVLVCPDIEAGISAYEALLGRSPDWRASSDGTATALFRVENTALELLAPDGRSEMATRLRAILDERGPGLTSLAFSCSDIEATHHKLARRGLNPDAVSRGASTGSDTGETRTWKRFRCDDKAMAGIKTFIIEPDAILPPTAPPNSSVSKLDHIVVATPNPDRALGLYGAKLGLDLALDRTREEWKTRFLFFRTGGLTFEIIHRLDMQHDVTGPDTIWGLTWAVDDIDAAHARLDGAGLEISDLRDGRKPGSKVFTVKNGTLDVPTLFISHTPR